VGMKPCTALHVESEDDLPERLALLIVEL
jgi:hypothetical protein